SREEGSQERACDHHGSRQALPCPFELRRLSAAHEAAAQYCRRAGNARARRYRLRAATRHPRHQAGRFLMMYVLDTNVVSELRKGRHKADANVTAWAECVDAADLFISAITVMELEQGVLSIERKNAA